jgi:transcriptional regulator with XRE-family HTH domain
VTGHDRTGGNRRRHDKVGDPILRTWGQNIEIARTRLGLSRDEFAAQLGVTMVTVWRWERDGREPRRQMKTRIAELTGQDVRLLFHIPTTSAA